MPSAFKYDFVYRLYCMLVKVAWCYIWNENIMIIIMLGDGCMTRDDGGMIKCWYIVAYWSHNCK